MITKDLTNYTDGQTIVSVEIILETCKTRSTTGHTYAHQNKLENVLDQSKIYKTACITYIWSFQIHALQIKLTQK